MKLRLTQHQIELSLIIFIMSQPIRLFLVDWLYVKDQPSELPFALDLNGIFRRNCVYFSVGTNCCSVKNRKCLEAKTCLNKTKNMDQEIQVLRSGTK